MTDHEQFLRAVYSAFNARDIDAAIAAMHPDVDWPNAWEGGRLHGRDAVREYWTRQWAEIDPHVEPRAFATIEDGRIAIEVHQLVRSPAGVRFRLPTGLPMLSIRWVVGGRVVMI